MSDEHVYADEGYSGSRLDRPGLDRRRDAVREGEVDVVGVLTPDRLARKYAYQVLRLEEFRKAGIELVAVSSDTTADLDKSIKKYQAEKTPPRPFPMPLVADPELRVFRQYRAYDDFERSPLHGTFLIDGQGLIRWQDIGPEPFMEADFLLSEAQRLLKQPPRRAGGVSPLIGRRQ